MSYKKVFRAHGYGLSIQTKSNLILRDLDLLKKINEKTKCVVQMTLTTYDEELCKILEPKVSTTKERVDVLNIMRENHIPTVVWLDPILPFINDTMENLTGILNYCIDAKVFGIICFGMGLTLREGNREYFYKKLEEHFPGLKQQYERRYGYSYEIESDHNAELMREFYRVCKQENIVCDYNQIFSYMHQFEEKEKVEQLSLFN